jgi:hypothetical protein
MAEQQASYQFETVTANDILAERQAGWEGFTRFATWSVATIVVVLILMAFFLV